MLMCLSGRLDWAPAKEKKVVTVRTELGPGIGQSTDCLVRLGLVEPGQGGSCW